jgi:hypothetical protein
MAAAAAAMIRQDVMSGMLERLVALAMKKTENHQWWFV